MNIAEINIEINENAWQVLADFGVSGLKAAGSRQGQIDSFNRALNCIRTTVEKYSFRQIQKNIWSLAIRREDNHAIAQFCNKGAPLFAQEFEASGLQLNMADALEIENDGRDGQKITLEYMVVDDNPFEETPLEKLKFSPEEIDFRELREGEENKLSRLFFSVYGHNYVNQDVYYPNKIRELINSHDLVSFVAIAPGGRIAGHVGLLKINDGPPVYEAALGIVDPNIKSKGIFSKLFKMTTDATFSIPMEYCLYDFVTNHDYSQREVYKYPTNELSINVGLQVSKTQAKLESLGIGKDAEDMDRYTLFVALRQLREKPFGTITALPINLGQRLEFLLEPLGIQWVPCSRFASIGNEGSYSKEVLDTQKSVHFYLETPGSRALSSIISEWKYYLKLGFQYASVDFPLDVEGIGQIYHYLGQNGFFLAGLYPFKKSEKLGLRLQSIGPTRVSWDSIKIWGERGQKLLKLVRDDYDRHGII